MKLYHRTTRANADLILREGFRNEKERYTSDFGDGGVWFSDVPKEACECDPDEAVVSVDLDFSSKYLSTFEWGDDETAYREWLIPAALVNSKVTRTRVC
jgi:hypothetical protein